MLVIAGAIPVEGLPLAVATPKLLEDRILAVNDVRIPCTMGTGALVTAAIVACGYLRVEGPLWVTAGDIGDGSGSRLIYRYLADNLPEISSTVLCFHYILPILTGMRNVIESVRRCEKRPVLIADAGGIYAAKAAGLAQEFDVFTPDAGEMAFLADPDATHPAYMQRHLFEVDTVEIPKLIERAYKYRNAARVLLIKNPIDYIVEDGRIITTVSEPNVPTLEPIGGTGDTIAGLVSALIFAGYEPVTAAIVAVRANRTAGKLAEPSTATKIWQIIRQFPYVFDLCLDEWTHESY